MKKTNQTILRRQGNKGKLIPDLLQIFPADITTFIDLFAGTLAVSLAILRAGRAHYAICNDNDGEVVNLWQVLKDRRSELEGALMITPYHAAIFSEFKRSAPPADPVWRAIRFLYLSNYSYLGGGDTFHISGRSHDRAIMRERLHTLCTEEFDKIQFLSCDFRDVLGRISLRTYANDPRRGRNERDSAFLYADPPYLGTDGNYAGFQENDLRDLLAMCVDSGLRFAVSEFSSPSVLQIVSEFSGLTIQSIGERRTIKSRNEEIVIFNYAMPFMAQPSLFSLS